MFEGRRCESKGPSQRHGVLEAAPVLPWGHRALPARGWEGGLEKHEAGHDLFCLFKPSPEPSVDRALS